MIPYGKQSIGADDIEAVERVLSSDFLTQGPEVPRFERAVANYCSASHAVAVNSATSALHLACLALDVGPGDVVWTSPITFVASANCALYCGAQVDFVDIDAQTYNLCPIELERKLRHARDLGLKLPKVVIPVHFSGQSCDMKKINALAGEYGFKIIEDGSHAIGGTYLGDLIGNCRYSDITVFSFHPVKIITSAEGGMALTNNPELAKRMRLQSSHGITRDISQMVNPSTDAWYYEQNCLGFNYRMTDMQAALGTSQLNKIDHFVGRRKEIANFYNERLASLPLILPWQSMDSISAYHLYVVRLSKELARFHSKFFSDLRANGIGVNLHYIPVYRQPYHAQFKYDKHAFSKSEEYYASAISLPIFPTISDTELDSVVEVINKCLPR
jgi:UDP-4-amino-4,6-dideoxy-N-acetyl-beta-L-altrosamine transaminase